MRGFPPAGRLPRILIYAAGSSALLLYLYLEPIAGRQLFMLFFAIAVWAENVRRRDLQGALLLSSFLLSADLLYALTYGFSLALGIVVMLTLMGALLLPFANGNREAVRRLAGFGILFTELSVLLAGLGTSALFRAGIATLALGSILETYANPYLKTWRVQQVYAILILFFSLVLFSSLYVTRI